MAQEDGQPEGDIPFQKAETGRPAGTDQRHYTTEEMNIKAVYKDMNAIGNNSILTLSRLWKDVMGVLGIVLLASCSETASVPEGDQLYTGQRKIKYENYVCNGAKSSQT